MNSAARSIKKVPNLKTKRNAFISPGNEKNDLNFGENRAVIFNNFLLY